MVIMAREFKEIKEEVLGILHTAEAAGKKYVIRVVCWGKGKPSLEKREQYEAEDGSTKNGKAKGFNKDDFELLLEKQDEILKMFGGEKSQKPEGLEAEEPPAEKDE